jgi:uncharacterized RDD family membrane protein YckC
MEDQLLDEGLRYTNAEPVELEMASQGKRFGTFIIDYVLSQFVVGILTVIYILLNPNYIEETEGINGKTTGMDLLLGFSGFILYYAFFEFICKGRTIGKMICGTRALTNDGEMINLGAALKRTLCRIVPFEPFSFLGRYASGWHDRWTDTMVVTEKSYQQSLR